MKITVFVLYIVIISTTTFAQGNYSGKLGYGLSPLGQPHDFSQFVPFLQEVANTCNGGIVYANADWRDIITTSGKIPETQKVVCELQPAPFNYVDMINYAWATYPELHLDVPSNSTNNWTNSEMKNLFLQMLINSADSLHPTYLFIGNEVNYYWEQDSLDYVNWVSFYNQAYDSIKMHSPATKVGTTFNYEHITGHGILTGWNTPYWNAFNNFDTNKLDIIGLTVYPFFNYQHASDVPLNYLDPIFSRIGNKPVVISETGWPGDSLIGSWYASSNEQVDYVNKIFNVIAGKNVEVVNWLFLNYMMDNTDTPAVKIFKSVALRDSLGNDRLALPVWISTCNSSTVESHAYQQAGLNSEVIKIFPNPSDGYISMENIGLNRTNNKLTIFDVFGNIVFEKRGLSENEKINLNLPNGIYFVQLKGDNFIQTKKLELIR